MRSATSSFARASIYQLCVLLPLFSDEFGVIDAPDGTFISSWPFSPTQLQPPGASSVPEENPGTKLNGLKPAPLAAAPAPPPIPLALSAVAAVCSVVAADISSVDPLISCVPAAARLAVPPAPPPPVMSEESGANADCGKLNGLSGAPPPRDVPFEVPPVCPGCGGPNRLPMPLDCSSDAMPLLSTNSSAI